MTALDRIRRRLAAVADHPQPWMAEHRDGTWTVVSICAQEPTVLATTDDRDVAVYIAYAAGDLGHLLARCDDLEQMVTELVAERDQLRRALG